MGGITVKHGCNRAGRPTPEYIAWGSMIARCYNPKTDMYYRYGGRGITVCDRWRYGENGGFEFFLADMGPRPTATHSLDRMDNNGNYEPSNCRWAERSTQARNKSNNRLVTAWGERMTFFEALQKANLTPHAFYMRMKRGLSETEALERPKQERYPFNRRSDFGTKRPKRVSADGIPTPAVGPPVPPTSDQR